MEFKQFNELLKQHIKTLTEGETYLFVTSESTRTIWHEYLESFPPGTNEIFRERREYDCSCCRQFIRTFGNVVAIKEGKAVSIWDFETGDSKYQTVIDALSKMVKADPVRDVFLPTGRSFGTKKNTEQLEDGSVHTWYHMQATIDKSVKTYREDQVGTLRGDFKAVRNVLQRSLTELTLESIDTVLDLIAQNSLYKGEEWDKPLKKFKALHKTYSTLPEEQQNNYCWTTSLEAGPAISKIKNHSIGVLLTDLSLGMDLNEAVKKYEKIVAPTNYKRPKAIYTKKMIEQAKAKVEELGLVDALGRRHAKLEDITVNNILFANRDTARKMSGDVFEELSESVPDKPQNFDKVEEVPIDTFVKEVLPTTTEIELLLENKHSSNMVSLIAPKVLNGKSLFKWNNGFSWAYAGNIADSMKERVKAAGGKVDGVLRFSIQWNDNGDNLDDLDAHCIEPNRNKIYYPNKGHVHRSSGMLDVDIIDPHRQTKDGVAVENITYSDISWMPEGQYQFLVHCYSSRSARSGFTAEIEYDGKVFSFSYSDPLRQDQKVLVAEVTLKKGQFSIKELFPSSMSSRTIWGLTSNKFHPVSACMYSPNYWDEQDGIGHRHYMFLLKGCKNEENPNGFFNEFLKEEFMEHKRVFEALGSKMKVEDSVDQLSGLGFSSTKRASLICRVKGSFTRVIKLVF